jgi:3-oxoacyl-[acyl-carrier-protein] synthase II
MSLYIQGTGYVFPLLADAGLQQFVNGGEPDYEHWMDIRQLRRMSRIIKMGVASAMMSLKNAQLEKPDGIITGSGYGCLDDSGIFLSKVVDDNAQLLNPTPFIQSTHNTIGSQIALLLQCQGYNQTYTQESFSLEHALLDALLLIQEQPDYNLLVGGADEVTSFSRAIHKRFRSFQVNDNRMGPITGEGAAYWIVSGKPTSSAKVSIESVSTCYKPTETELRNWVGNFLNEAGLAPEAIDLLLIGRPMNDAGDFMHVLTDNLMPHSAVGFYKHICGEFPVASTFALCLGAEILERQQIPEAVMARKGTQPLHHVLIYNQYFNTHHSLILLKPCRAMPS